jgi:hypothetical protein
MIGGFLPELIVKLLAYLLSNAWILKTRARRKVDVGAGLGA